METGKIFEPSSDKANEAKIEKDFKEISWKKCQSSSSSQIPSQDNLNDYHQFLSLYKFNHIDNRTKLVIYDTENEKVEVKILDTQLILDRNTCTTQLPSGELFCYHGWEFGLTLIIDRNYTARTLPSGTPCNHSSIIYFENSVYCFGGGNENGLLTLSRKFDLEKELWIDLAPLPGANAGCHSVIFNRNILISGHRSKNLWLYSVEINSFSTILYEFADRKRKFLINVEKLYLIEWGEGGLIYEGEDEYHWEPISKPENIFPDFQMYCLYNKEKVYISTWKNYCKFDLKEKVVLKIE